MGAYRGVRAGAIVGYVAAFGLALSACGNVMDSLGLTKKPPDEFRVVTRAPLSLPPDFVLRPPRPGAPRPQEPTRREKARSTLYGAPSQPARGSRSKGEQALLKSAGATDVSPVIRLRVEREQAIRADEDETPLEALMFWKTSEPPSTVVDATREAERIRQASAVGELPSEGETAVIERRKKTIFDILF